MGAAKRRKQAGTYPDTAAIAAARRTLGTGPVPVEQLEVPPGILGITLDVEGADPSTVMFDITQIAKIEAAAAALVSPGMDYGSMVRGLADEFVRIRRRGDDLTLTGIGVGVLWTCFNHPQCGDSIRRQVSAKLRQDGRAHLTWCFGRHGLALGLAERFVDMEGIVAIAPKDSITVVDTATEHERSDA